MRVDLLYNMDNMPSCFLCRRNNFKLKYSLPGKDIYECQNDGLFISPTKKSIKNLYGREYYVNNPYPLFFYQGYFQKKIDLIKRLIKSQRPEILDVGSGWGQFLETVRKNNLPYKGIDVSVNAVKICRAKKLNCQPITIEELAKKEKNQYCAITGFQTIEHLTNPFSFLKAAHTLLKKGGVILLTTPNNDSSLRKIMGNKWSVYNTDSHFVFYNKRTLKKTLRQSGFSHIEVKNDSWRFMSLGYVLSRLRLPYLNKLSLPVPTDFWGDLQAVGVKI